ncbi:uncharacterized protein N7496_003070 [Penicillium cataractarum]|uniref:Uncharacterized protein n=1 Tax=Penicillium cataractarum TaxID=2100454 RepID=A0A9W9SLU3_9EURO|nr:uncharacterized protein N7496_003070 [Penicillium cataractarum]KAJ5380642.1 hypothetical protein N7496_003070 [Penicillium cataractarum]
MSRYSVAHADPQGANDARPTAMQIIHDEQMEDKLVGKAVIITGVSSGLGVETARALAATGATLYMTARDLDRAKSALGDIFDPHRMELIHMDHTSLESVRTAAQNILSKTDKITILVCNAGVMAVKDLQLTDQGYELQFATNHLAHFLFFELLRPALLAGSSSEFQSRVVIVSSSSHRMARGLGPSDNYHYQKGGYDPRGAYAQSKIANVYMANEIERRYGSQGLHATSLNPGIIATSLGRHMSEEEIQALLQNPMVQKFQKSPEQGAATTVWGAVSEELAGKGGLLLDNCAVAARGDYDENPLGGDAVPHTYCAEDEARLWKDSLEMVGLSSEN